MFGWSKNSISQKEPLVTREELEKLIDATKGLEEYRDFLKGRWVRMVMWWHDRSVEARRRYFGMRRIVVVGGVLIPVFAVLGMRPEWQFFASLAVAVIGAAVAGCAAWEGVANYGEIWREKRRASELLKVEGWQFFQLCGKYQEEGDHKKAYGRFATEVEAMIAKEIGEYLGAFDPSLTQARQHATTIADKIAGEVKTRLA